MFIGKKDGREKEKAAPISLVDNEYETRLAVAEAFRAIGVDSALLEVEDGTGGPPLDLLDFVLAHGAVDSNSQVRVHGGTYLYLCICINIYMINVDLYKQIYVSISILRIYMYTNVYTCILMYIHVYIYIYIQVRGAMLTAGRAIVDAYGASLCSPMLALLEGMDMYIYVYTYMYIIDICWHVY
jgi:hypothetical protein